jgi:hypothetical protein
MPTADLPIVLAYGLRAGVCWPWIPTRCACAGAIGIAAMGVTVDPIHPTFVGSGRMLGLRCCESKCIWQAILYTYWQALSEP